MDNLFRNAFVAHARSALARADALGKYGHAGHRGSLREIIASDLLQKVLPPEVKAGSGQLVACNGRTSGQIDLVLYAPSIIVPALYNEREGYFAVESCLYALEIKSTLSRSGLTQAYDSAVLIRSLPLLPAEHWTRNWNPPLRLLVTPTAYPIVGIFAFSSDLTGEPAAEIARYRAIDPNADERPALSLITVRGRGYWYFANGWKYVPATENLREVLGLLAGIVNTIPQLLAFKGRSKVGNYLSSDQETHEIA